MDKGAWQATVHGVANSWTQLSDTHTHTHTHTHVSFIEKQKVMPGVPAAGSETTQW